MKYNSVSMLTCHSNYYTIKEYFQANNFSIVNCSNEGLQLLTQQIQSLLWLQYTILLKGSGDTGMMLTCMFCIGLISQDYPYYIYSFENYFKHQKIVQTIFFACKIFPRTFSEKISHIFLIENCWTMSEVFSNENYWKMSEFLCV